MVNRGSNWDEVQLNSVSSPPDIEGLSAQEAVETIKEWFFENFEDPVEITPYESREGGYQYIWGGPYDAADIVGDVFSDTASEAIIEAAVDAIQADGTWEWAPNHRRIQPPEDDDSGTSGTKPEYLHARMLERLDALEEALKGLPEERPGIGHNQPPEPIEPQPLDQADRQNIVSSIAILRSQPASPDVGLADIRNAANFLKSVGEKISTYLADKADIFVTEAVKSAGNETGKWGARLAIWGLLAKHLAEAGQSALDWITSLGIF